MAAQILDGRLKPDAHVLVVSSDRFAELARDDDEDTIPAGLLRLVTSQG